MHKMLTRLRCFLSSALAELRRQEGSHERLHTPDVTVPLKRMTKNSGAECLSERQEFLCTYPALIKMIHFHFNFGGASNVMLAKSESPCVLCVPCGSSALQIHSLNFFVTV